MILKVFWIKHCFEKAFTKHSLDGHIACVFHLNVMKSRVDDSSGLLILRSLLKYCGRLLTARHHNHTQVSAKHFRLKIRLSNDGKGFALTWLKYSPSEESVVSALVTGQNQQLCKPCFHPPIYSALQGPGKENNCVV